MPSLNRNHYVSIAILVVIGVIFAVFLSGRFSTGDSMVQIAIDKSGKPAAELGKMKGKVTIDGQPPATGSDLIVFLNDPTNLPDPSRNPPWFCPCDSQGNFFFSTRMNGDGVAVGKYIVTFAKLRPVGLGGRDGYKSPDELKNLYNDPEKNATIPEFNISVEAAGKNDYVFDLTVDGKQPVTTPGAHAFTAIDYGRHRGR
jgi:hypothetical protein